VQPQVLGGAPTSDHERVVVGRSDLVEVGVQREVVAALLAVGLVTLEVMNRRADLVPAAFAWTHGVDRVPHHVQRLERHHRLVVFGVVAYQHQDLLGHVPPSLEAETPRPDRA
jgi:hypothetical protein